MTPSYLALPAQPMEGHGGWEGGVLKYLRRGPREIGEGWPRCLPIKPVTFAAIISVFHKQGGSGAHLQPIKN